MVYTILLVRIGICTNVVHACMQACVWVILFKFINKNSNNKGYL